jgi:hypothetical protein
MKVSNHAEQKSKMKKRKSKKILQKKFPDILHVYELKPFNTDLIIFASENLSNFTEHLNKKENKPISDWLKKYTKEFKIPKDDCGGGVFFNEDEKPLVFFIKQKKRDWNFYGSIIHEIMHTIDGLGIFFGCSKENEFRAYMFETMFQDIRKLLK